MRVCLDTFRTVWYELLFREFPFAKQPPEYIIWRAGNSLKQPLSSVHISKNAKVNVHLFSIPFVITQNSKIYFHCFLFNRILLINVGHLSQMIVQILQCYVNL
jgi:hypothetical protein